MALIAPTVEATIAPLTSTLTVLAVNVPNVDADTVPLASTVIEPLGLFVPAVPALATAKFPVVIVPIASLPVTVIEFPAPALIVPTVTLVSEPVDVIVVEPAGVREATAAPPEPILPIVTLPVLAVVSIFIESWLSTVPIVAPPFQPDVVTEIAVVLAAAPRTPVFRADVAPLPVSFREPTLVKAVPVMPLNVKFLDIVALRVLSAPRLEAPPIVTLSAAVIVMSVALAAETTPLKVPLAVKVTLPALAAMNVPVEFVNLATSIPKVPVLEAVRFKALASFVVLTTVSAATVL